MVAPVGHQPNIVPNDLNDIPEGPQARGAPEHEMMRSVANQALKAVANTSIDASVKASSEASKFSVEVASPNVAPVVGLLIDGSSRSVISAIQDRAADLIDRIIPPNN